MKQFVFLLNLFVLAFRTAVGETSLTCGDTSDGTEDVIHFKSPGYPNVMLSGNSDCKVTINVNSLTHYLRIDFKNVTMDGLLLAGHHSQRSGCDSDMFLFRGFNGWAPPPRCGALTNYSYVIPPMELVNKLDILAVMSSSAYQWHIMVTKVPDPLFEERIAAYRNLFNIFNRVFNVSKPINKREVPLIRNGNNTHISSVPWQASIRDLSHHNDSTRSFNEGTHICGGVIVHEQFILTAAHCFYGWSKFRPMRNLTNTKIVLGDSNVCTHSEDPKELKSQDYKIDTVIFHAGYDPYFPLHDIAIVRLQTTINFTVGHIQAIDVALSGSKYDKDVPVYVSGFGSWNKRELSYSKKEWNEDSARFYPCQLQITQVQLAGYSTCICNEVEREVNNKYTYCDLFSSPKYRFLVDSMCSVTNASDLNSKKTSHGDSGGPVFLYNGTRPVLIGLVLSNRPRANMSYDNYFSLAPYESFIRLTVLSFAESPNETLVRMINENMECLSQLNLLIKNISNIIFRIYADICAEEFYQRKRYACGYSENPLQKFYQTIFNQRGIGNYTNFEEEIIRSSAYLDQAEECKYFRSKNSSTDWLSFQGIPFSSIFY